MLVKPDTLSKHITILALSTLHFWIKNVFSIPGRSQGLFYKHRCHSLICSFVKLFSSCHGYRRRQALTEIFLASSHKIDILNFKGYPNCIIGSKDTAILLNWWISLLAQLHGEGLRSGLVLNSGKNSLNAF